MLICCLSGVFHSPALYVRAYAEQTPALGALCAAEEYIAVHPFSAVMTGTVRAKVFGIPYTQTVAAERVVSGASFTETVVSASAFVKAAARRGFDGADYTVARGEFKGGRVEFSPPAVVSESEFTAAYGRMPIYLTKYDTAAIVTAETLADGVFRYELEPERATVYSRREVSSALGGKAEPEYERVEFTLEVAEDGRPVRVTTREKFDINKFGGVSCVAEYTETFDWRS